VQPSNERQGISQYKESLRILFEKKINDAIPPGVDPIKLLFFAIEEFFRFLLVSLRVCCIIIN